MSIHTPQPANSSSTPYTVKGDLKEYIRSLGIIRPTIAFIVTFYLWWRFDFTVWFLTVLFLAAVIGIGLYLVSRRSITLDTEGLTYRNSFNKKTYISYKDIESAKVYSAYNDTVFGPTPRLSVANRSHTQAVSLFGLYWPNETFKDMPRVLESHNVNVEYNDEVVTYADIARNTPAYASNLERHPYKLGMIIFAILVPIIFLVAYVITFEM